MLLISAIFPLFILKKYLKSMKTFFVSSVSNYSHIRWNTKALQSLKYCTRRQKALVS